MKFLMGLNDSYAAIRGQILLMDPLPSINRIYGLILQEECQRNIHVSPSIDAVALAAKGILPSPTNRVPPRKKHLKCTHCHKDGHTIDRCYLIHGFPHGSRKTGSNHKASVHHVSSATNKSTTNSLPFTLDQCQQLLALLNNANPSSSMANHVGLRLNDEELKRMDSDPTYNINISGDSKQMLKELGTEKAKEIVAALSAILAARSRIKENSKSTTDREG
ncbi:hypothetical protein F0562_030330 [Nyssa sinensis]|uniref:Uncharacterized protein n=1 Tax=Nyssa sinensis TaxID=561372 RepID=A0A5J5B0P1_9ASTE|nr:hypothetical protein F0562_030330 [Nyssa sinensis]